MNLTVPTQVRTLFHLVHGESGGEIEMKKIESKKPDLMYRNSYLTFGYITIVLQMRRYLKEP
jgi:hypothetical protein